MRALLHSDGIAKYLVIGGRQIPSNPGSSGPSRESSPIQLREWIALGFSYLPVISQQEPALNRPCTLAQGSAGDGTLFLLPPDGQSHDLSIEATKTVWARGTGQGIWSLFRKLLQASVSVDHSFSGQQAGSHCRFPRYWRSRPDGFITCSFPFYRSLPGCFLTEAD